MKKRGIIFLCVVVLIGLVFFIVQAKEGKKVENEKELKPEKIKEQALKLEEKGNWEEALEYWQKYGTFYPLYAKDKDPQKRKKSTGFMKEAREGFRVCTYEIWLKQLKEGLDSIYKGNIELYELEMWNMIRDVKSQYKYRLQLSEKLGMLTKYQKQKDKSRIDELKKEEEKIKIKYQGKTSKLFVTCKHFNKWFQEKKRKEEEKKLKEIQYKQEKVQGKSDSYKEFDVKKVDDTKIQNFIGFDEEPRAVAYRKSIYFYDRDGHLKNKWVFNSPIETVTSENGKYMGIFPYKTEFTVIKDKDAPNKAFTGVINNEGNIIWKDDEMPGITKVSNDGKLAVYSGDALLHTGQYLYLDGKVIKLSNYEWVECIISEDSKYIFTGDVGSGVVNLYDNNGKELWSFQAPNRGHPFIAISPDNTYFLIWVNFDYIYLFDKNYNLLWKKESKELPGGQLPFFINNNQLIISSRAKCAYCLSVENGNLQWKLEKENKDIYFKSVEPLFNDLIIVESINEKSINGRTISDLMILYIYNIKRELLWKKVFVLKEILADEDFYSSWIENTQIKIDKNKKILYINTPTEIYKYNLEEIINGR
jgi:outer membrane protein assembly factor BamB